MTITTATTAAEDTTSEASRIATVEQFAYRMRHNVIDMGEEQGQGYVGQALGAADIFATVYADRLRYRADDPAWEGRDRFLLSTGHYAIGLYAALAEAGIIPRSELQTYGSDDSRCRCRRCPRTPPAWKFPAAPSATASPSRSGCARAAPPALHRPRLQLPVRRRTRRGLDVGGGHGRPPPPARQSHRDGRHQRPPGRRCDLHVLSTEPVHDKWAACGWHVERVDGNDVTALVRAFDNAAAESDGKPSIILCDTRVGKGVPLLESREKAHFMRIDEHEWQICRDQLTAGFDNKDA